MDKPTVIVLVVVALIGFCWSGELENPSVPLQATLVNFNSSAEYADSDFELIDEMSRIKRNILLGTNNLNPQGQNVEGLLSSCQLTNLLLYQLINQKFSSIGSSPSLQPLSYVVGSNNQNSFNAPILQTFLSTSIVLNEMTSTSTHTVTLMFGNKESTAVITDTKIFNVTSSQIFTLTSTIQPTLVSGEIEASATFLPDSLAADEENLAGIQYGKGFRRENFAATPVLEQVGTTKRRKHRKDTSREEPDLTPTRKYSRQENRFAGRKQQLTSERPVPEDNYYSQKDYSGQHFYIRRPKRRGDELDNYDSLSNEGEYENSETPSPIDYLLEPSYDAGTVDADVPENKCPEPNEITKTVTKTVTKFVNAPSSIRFSTGETRVADAPNYVDSGRVPPPAPVVENFRNKEHRSFRPKARTNGYTTEDPDTNSAPVKTNRLRNSENNSNNRQGKSRTTFQAAKYQNTYADTTDTSRSSSRFARTRGITSTTTPSPYANVNIDENNINRKRSSSRFRGNAYYSQSTTTVAPVSERHSGRFRSKSSTKRTNIFESTTRPPSRFWSRVKNEYTSTTTTTEEPIVEVAERKFTRFNSRTYTTPAVPDPELEEYNYGGYGYGY